MPRSTSHTFVSILAIAGALTLSGCGKPQFTENEPTRQPAPSEPAPAAPVQAPQSPFSTVMPSQMPGGAPIPQVTNATQRFTWTAPEHWMPGPPSQMRVGSYTIPGAGGPNADLAITTFPGDVGGDLANINRWRMGVGLPPLNNAEGVGTPVSLGGVPGRWMHLEGTQASMLIAWVKLGEASWFFRMTGSPAVIANEVQAFTQFLETVRVVPAN